MKLVFCPSPTRAYKWADSDVIKCSSIRTPIRSVSISGFILQLCKFTNHSVRWFPLARIPFVTDNNEYRCSQHHWNCVVSELLLLASHLFPIAISVQDHSPGVAELLTRTELWRWCWVEEWKPTRCCDHTAELVTTFNCRRIPREHHTLSIKMQIEESSRRTLGVRTGHFPVDFLFSLTVGEWQIGQRLIG